MTESTDTQFSNTTTDKMDENSCDEITVVSPGSQVLFELDPNLPPHLKIVDSSDGLLVSQVTAQDGALFPKEWRGKRYTPEFWSQHEDQILVHILTPTFRRELEFGDNGSFLLYSTMTQTTETRYGPPKEGDNTVRARLEEMKSQGPQFYHRVYYVPPEDATHSFSKHDQETAAAYLYKGLGRLGSEVIHWERVNEIALACRGAHTWTDRLRQMADSEPKEFVEDCLNSRLEGKFGAIKLTIDKARHEDLFVDFESDSETEPETNEAMRRGASPCTSEDDNSLVG